MTSATYFVASATHLVASATYLVTRHVSTYLSRCEVRIGAGPPLAKTEVFYVDLKYWGMFGLDPSKRRSGLVGHDLITVQTHRLSIVLAAHHLLLFFIFFTDLEPPET